MSKHTPGPWALSDIVGTRVIVYPEHEPNTFVADVRLGCVPAERETALADARLIGAAPELLAACKEYVSFVLADQPARWTPAFPLILEAIRKAEGK